MRGISLAAALLLAAPFALASAGDVAVAGADCISFGTTARDAQDPALATWYAEHVAADPAHAYPGYGDPRLNAAGDRTEVHFTDRGGARLAGVIYHPPAPHGLVTPILFLEGLDTNTALYEWWHLDLASRGYLVFAVDFEGQGQSESGNEAAADQAADAITWLLADSPVASEIDAQHLGVAGHSMGAITAMSLQDHDARVKAVVAAAVIDKIQTTFTQATIPIQIQSGDQDGPIAPYPFTGPFFARGVYDEITGPRELVNIEGGTHAAHTNGPFLPTTTWGQDVAAKYSAAWFDHYLRGAPADAIVAGDPHLSKMWPSAYDLTDVAASGTLDAGGPTPSCASETDAAA